MSIKVSTLFSELINILTLMILLQDAAQLHALLKLAWTSKSILQSVSTATPLLDSSIALAMELVLANQDSTWTVQRPSNVSLVRLFSVTFADQVTQQNASLVLLEVFLILLDRDAHVVMDTSSMELTVSNAHTNVRLAQLLMELVFLVLILREEI